MNSILTANNVQDLRAKLKVLDLPGPDKFQHEISTLRCWARSQLFEQTILGGEEFTLFRNHNDPPDFVLSSGSGDSLAIEVTMITQQRYEVWKKERDGGNPTSTFLVGKPDAAFRTSLRKFDLPGDFPRDGWVPHNEIEEAYFLAATETITRKSAALSRYVRDYDRTTLLVSDKLTHADSQFAARSPLVARLIRSLPNDQRFSSVVLIDDAIFGGLTQGLLVTYP